MLYQQLILDKVRFCLKNSMHHHEVSTACLYKKGVIPDYLFILKASQPQP